MSVTALVSHVLMWPYVLAAVVASSHHAVTAVWRLAVSKTKGVGVGFGPPPADLRIPLERQSCSWFSACLSHCATI